MAEIVPIGKAKPVDEVISLARYILEQAEAGNFRELSYIARCSDGSHMHAMTECEDQMLRLGQLTRLQLLVHRAMEQSCEAITNGG